MSRISKRRQDFQDEVAPLLLFIVSILSRMIGLTGLTGEEVIVHERLTLNLANLVNLVNPAPASIVRMKRRRG